MNVLRKIGTMLLYAPVIGMIGTMVAVGGAFDKLAETNGSATPETLAHHILVGVYATMFAIIAFPLGVMVHGVVAKRSGVYRRSVWRLILSSSILMCLSNPVGIFLGGPTIALIFKLNTFKKMKTAEPIN